ncbi:MAG: tryptophan 2,3-dioxygenase [Sandaracinaceae bacterium]|nr:tryptophan 2,3-dioxygenase [Sandaracinaceae bacterium]
MTRKPTAYWDYIRVEELLALQGGIVDDDSTLANDEVLFITIHQIDELWFKLAIRELVSVRELFARDRVPEQSLSSAVRGLRRIAQLFEHIASHFQLMETMTTRDYLAFRDKLSPASGFQSAQLREVEIVLGLDDAQRIPLGHEGSYLRALLNPDGTESPASRRVKARLADPTTVASAVADWLYRTPIDGSTPGQPDDDATVERFVDAYLEAHARENDRARELAQHDALTEADGERLDARYAAAVESTASFLRAEDVDPSERLRRRRIRAALVLIEGYRELPLLAWPREVVDAIVALEQSFVIFRQRHARMVERIIGRRIGTGGSAGVDYLDQTALRYRVFHDVWAVRTLQIRRAALPPLKNEKAYGISVGD